MRFFLFTFYRLIIAQWYSILSLVNKLHRYELLSTHCEDHSVIRSLTPPQSSTLYNDMSGSRVCIYIYLKHHICPPKYCWTK